MFVIGLSLVGLCIGSFVNAWVLRLRAGKSVSRGRSECPDCHHQLSWQDLIPVVSYIQLRGKCRYCGKPISRQYLVGELATAVTFGLLAWHFGVDSKLALINLAIWLVIATLLIAAAIYDARWRLLPDLYLIPAMILAVSLLLINYFHFGQHQVAANVVGMVVFTVFYLLLYGVSRGRWIGQGDILLAAIMGFLLAPSQLAVAVFASYMLGAVVGIVVLKRKQLAKDHHIAFGPFLVVGLFVGLLWGQSIVSWYVGLI
jgi:prepilin signal peptidase PulO-like enzyme (type II secretory pathway)